MWKPLFLTFVIFIVSLNQEIKAQTIEDEIIVQSSKLQVDGIYGAETYTISKSDIQNSTSDSIIDLITEYPGVKKQFDIYGTGFGVGSRVDIRGFADTARDNTAILINGQKLTLADMSLVDLSIIPMDSIQRIEITKVYYKSKYSFQRDQLSFKDGYQSVYIKMNRVKEFGDLYEKGMNKAFEWAKIARENGVPELKKSIPEPQPM